MHPHRAIYLIPLNLFCCCLLYAKRPLPSVVFCSDEMSANGIGAVPEDPDVGTAVGGYFSSATASLLSSVNSCIRAACCSSWLRGGPKGDMMRRPSSIEIS